MDYLMLKQISFASEDFPHSSQEVSWIWILRCLFNWAWVLNTFSQHIQSKVSPHCGLAGAELVLYEEIEGLPTYFTRVGFSPVWMRWCWLRWSPSKAFATLITLIWFSLQCGFSDVAEKWWITNKKLFHTHYTHKVSLQCEFSGV